MSPYWPCIRLPATQQPTWGPYDMIEVYDDGDHPLFRLSNTGHLSLLAG